MPSVAELSTKWSKESGQYRIQRAFTANTSEGAPGGRVDELGAGESGQLLRAQTLHSIYRGYIFDQCI